MNTGRRGFLRALAIAPAAIPVAAKVAATKMGLTSVTSAGLNEQYPVDGIGYAQSVGCDGDWARNALKELMSTRAVKERRNQAKRMAMTLDADLAASRSMSPSVAYGIQIERCYKQLTEDQKGYYLDEIENAAKRTMGLS